MAAAKENLSTILLTMILYVVLLLLVSSIVQLSYNNVLPHITKNSAKFPQISLVQAMSLVILMSTLVKCSCVCVQGKIA